MIIYIVLFACGLLLAAFAAAAETAVTSVSRLKIRSLLEEGHRGATRVARIHNNPNRYLSTILTVNTIAVIVASTAATLFAVRQLPHIPEFIITIVLSLFILIVCEIFPKSLALRSSTAFALFLAPIVSLFAAVLGPVVIALTWMSTTLIRVTTRHEVRGPFLTEDELKVLITVGEQEGVVEYEEREMIHGILEMTDKLAREVMIPRIDVVGIGVDESIDDVIALIVDHGHSRIPVYEDTIDNIMGVIYAKDLLRGRVKGEKVSLKTIARQPYFTPDAKKVGELLHEMQERKVHMAIVVDEYGGTAGIVTIEDLIEEIVGPIRDEYDIAEQEDMQFLSDHEIIVNARVSIDEVREIFDLDIGDDVEADSIGGLMYERLGKIPEVGAKVVIGEVTLVVEAVRRQSIQLVRVLSTRPLLRQHMRRNHEEPQSLPDTP